MSFHLMADLKLQGEINEGKCYLLRTELCLPQIHMLRISSLYCPLLSSTMFSRMEGWRDGWMEGIFFFLQKYMSDHTFCSQPLLWQFTLSLE